MIHCSVVACRCTEVWSHLQDCGWTYTDRICCCFASLLLPCSPNGVANVRSHVYWMLTMFEKNTLAHSCACPECCLRHRYYRAHRSSQYLRRTVRMPESANLEQMKARYVNWVLQLTVPKKQVLPSQQPTGSLQ